MAFGPTTEAPRRLLVPVPGPSNAHPTQSAMKLLFVPAAGAVRRRTRGPPRGVHIIRIRFVHRLHTNTLYAPAFRCDDSAHTAGRVQRIRHWPSLEAAGGPKPRCLRHSGERSRSRPWSRSFTDLEPVADGKRSIIRPLARIVGSGTVGGFGGYGEGVPVASDTHPMTASG